jgi:hypothetical protein
MDRGSRGWGRFVRIFSLLRESENIRRIRKIRGLLLLNFEIPNLTEGA